MVAKDIKIKETYLTDWNNVFNNQEEADEWGKEHIYEGLDDGMSDWVYEDVTEIDGREALEIIADKDDLLNMIESLQEDIKSLEAQNKQLMNNL